MKLITTEPDRRRVAQGGKPAPRKPVDMAYLTLELAAALGRHLDLEALIDHFSRRVGDVLPHDSLSFRHQLAGDWRVIAHGSGGRHSCAYELKVEDLFLGTLRISRRQRFEESELATLEQLIGVLVYPLRNALLYRRAQYDAATDPLTGLSNRGVFGDALPREISRALRYGTALTLLMVDLDNLKAINDSAGHGAGDRGLQRVAQALRAGLRDSDHIFRYGGDEFAVLLVGSEGDAGRDIAERLRSHVEGLPVDPGTEKLTLSIGVAGLCATDTPEALFERADAALYRAKKAGRNRVGEAE
ncbi:MAG: GGDEF domain-containing protein [Pseudomonadota bacterium]